MCSWNISVIISTWFSAVHLSVGHSHNYLQYYEGFTFLVPLLFRQLPGTCIDGGWRAWGAADVIGGWRGRTAAELPARRKHTVHWTDIGRWVVEHWACLLYNSVPHYMYRDLANLVLYGYILLVKHDSKNSCLILSPVMNCLRRNPGTRATEHDTTGLLNLQCEAIWQMTRYCSWNLVSMPWPLPVFDCFFSIQIWRARALGDLIMCDNVM